MNSSSGSTPELKSRVTCLSTFENGPSKYSAAARGLLRVKRRLKKNLSSKRSTPVSLPSNTIEACTLESCPKRVLGPSQCSTSCIVTPNRNESTKKALKHSYSCPSGRVSFDAATIEQGTTFRKQTREGSFSRRSNIDALNLSMGLTEDSCDFLDWVIKAKCRDWLKSLSRRDPRACIKSFFDDVAKDGADDIEDPNGKGFHPELLSPLLSMFQRSSVFSVWRPTSIDSIRKMMTGQGTGKGLDIKGKSAKHGKLSAYVPFMQIHEECHKKKNQGVVH